MTIVRCGKQVIPCPICSKKFRAKVPITDVEDTILMLEESDNEDLMNTDYDTDDDVVNFLSLSRIRGNTAPALVAAPVTAPVTAPVAAPVTASVVDAPVADSLVNQYEPMNFSFDSSAPDVITDTPTVESNPNDSLMKANWIETFILKFLYKTPFSDSTMESV
uniref:E3 SUMO-protein ligase NSE2 n=1 Tax=Strongyloides papillosus TaxID=174720 RepID=A0A0N5BZF0_STREA